MNLSNEQIEFLFSPVAIRQRCQKIWDLTKHGKTNFSLQEEKLAPCAEFVLEVIRDNYPDLKIPFHSRWGHFQAGGVDRNAILEKQLQDLDPREKARVKIDLVILSVLLDAGAGAQWKYNDRANDCVLGRSEGLAIASFDMFLQKAFSSSDKLGADAEALIHFNAEMLKKGFQVSEENPLTGIEGRVSLINNLGKTILANEKYFPGQRPGGLVDYLEQKHGSQFEVQDILKALLWGLGPIWPGRLQANHINLGDTWKYPLGGSEFDNLVVFHKLSQWLTYSLVEPMLESGLKITGAEKLTGLAEYRNGGLFVDMGVLKVRDPKMLETPHRPDSEFIIEWRALTVCLLDKIAEIIRNNLNFSEENFPLAKVLEGGTWHAGRKIAQTKREMATPPIAIESDGTVF